MKDTLENMIFKDTDMSVKLTAWKCMGRGCPCNGLWRPIGLQDVEAATFSRQWANRWQ
jgi:hypothetical protein